MANDPPLDPSTPRATVMHWFDFSTESGFFPSPFDFAWSESSWHLTRTNFSPLNVKPFAKLKFIDKYLFSCQLEFIIRSTTVRLRRTSWRRQNKWARDWSINWFRIKIDRNTVNYKQAQKMPKNDNKLGPKNCLLILIPAGNATNKLVV